MAVMRKWKLGGLVLGCGAFAVFAVLAVPGVSMATLLRSAVPNKHREPMTLTMPIVAGDAAHAANFHSDPLAGFESMDAATVRINATRQNRLGRQIAEALLKPSASSQAQRMMVTMSSLALGRDSIEFPITWADGSRSTYRMTSATVGRASYVRGSGRDSDGNRFIEAGRMHPDWADEFAGVYRFSSDRNLEAWVYAASFYAVKVQGSPSGARAISCERVADGLDCAYL